MIRYFSLVRHDPENNLYGDCVRAVIASLLEIDPIKVPHFFEQNDDTDKAWRRIDLYLATLGLATAFVHFNGEQPLSDVLSTMKATNPGIYYMIFGQSPTAPHVVIGLNDQIVHDPSWMQNGLVSPQIHDDGQALWTICLLISNKLKV